MRRRALKIHPADNVAVALVDLAAGERLSFEREEIALVSRVPAKHKFALEDLAPEDPVRMYGVIVGRAILPIKRGELLTTRNVRHAASPFQRRAGQYVWVPPDVARWRERTFMGYHRADGRVGTRNYWLVIPLVFCENRNVEVIKQAFAKELGFAGPEVYQRVVADLVKLYREGRTEELKGYRPPAERDSDRRHSRLFAEVDGVKFLTHEGGCGGTREDARALCGLLAGYITHPNVAGATVLSLGCQHAQVAMLREEIARRDPGFAKSLLVFEQQRSRSEREMLIEAIKATFLGLVEANEQRRQPASLSALTVGLKCGGSDGFSGISANPAIGHVADLVVALGGRAILSEFPELCGVEQELIDRCVSDEVAERFVHLMRAYEERARAVGSGFDMNPSPGNIRDGLITDAMKSAGAARKGGTSPIMDVLDYPERVTEPGLNLLCTPGNDVEAVTAQVGAGANVVLFTTGLGTPTGNPIAPVIKLATNSELAERMSDIIDFDCGGIVRGEKTIEQTGEEILEFVIRVASGEVWTKAELLGQDDFIPWKRGVSL